MKINPSPRTGIDSTVIAEVRRANSAAAKNYEPKPYSGKMLLFRAKDRPNEDRFYKVDSTNGWHSVVQGSLNVIPLPGNHANLLTAEHAPAAARALRPYLLAPPNNGWRK